MLLSPKIKKIHLNGKRNKTPKTNPPYALSNFKTYDIKDTINKNIFPNKNYSNLVKKNSRHLLRKNILTPKYKYDSILHPSNIMTPNNKEINLLKDNLNLSISTERKIFDNKSIFTSIITKIENIMLKYKKNELKLYSLLIEIDYYINKMIGYEENANITDFKTFSPKNKLINSNINSSNEDKIVKNNENHLLKKKINKLYQKINEMEYKFKVNELNYFFCIGDYQKKINDLEKKLNMKKINKIPKNELKEFICYPHYMKFDVKEDINPKSIPMFNARKNKNKTIILNNKEKNNEFFDFNQNEKDTENIFKVKNDINENNIENLEKIYNNKNIIRLWKGLELNEVKNTIELGKKKYSEQIPIADKFFGREKSFFISHPKLNYIKIGKNGNQLTSWKIDNQLNNFPKQISKLKISKSQKNAIIVFPSSFNETMVNLEKLKINKNFQSIENKFEESLKKNKKTNKKEN